MENAVGVDELHDEYIFTDWEGVDSNTVYALGEIPDIETANRVARLSSDERDTLEAILSKLDISEALDIVEVGNYTVYPVDSMSEVAELKAREEYANFAEIPEEIRLHIDFESWGETLDVNGEFCYDEINRQYIEVYT